MHLSLTGDRSDRVGARASSHRRVKPRESYSAPGLPSRRAEWAGEPFNTLPGPHALPCSLGQMVSRRGREHGA